MLHHAAVLVIFVSGHVVVMALGPQVGYDYTRVYMDNSIFFVLSLQTRAPVSSSWAGLKSTLIIRFRRVLILMKCLYKSYT